MTQPKESRTFLYKSLNKLFGIGIKVGLIKTHFDAERYLEEASKKLGLTDYGDMRFLENLNILTKDMEESAQLNSFGQFAQYNQLRISLETRLHAQELLRQHPEILEYKFAPPVVIVGLMRTGTTRLHRLIGSDPRFLNIKFWEASLPVPYDEESFVARQQNNFDADPRIKSVQSQLDSGRRIIPHIHKYHPLRACDVEEEIGLLQPSFSSQAFQANAYLPNFANWLDESDQTFAYEYMKTLLKIICWFRKHPENKPFIFKAPQHTGNLDALLHIFPDAKIVFTHRDPIKAIASNAAFLSAVVGVVSDRITPNMVARFWFEVGVKGMNKMLASRDALLSSENQLDIFYSDVSKDWEAEMGKIYDFAGMPFTTEARDGMKSWLADNYTHKHGRYSYSLADFGLQEAEVDEAFQSYRERFGVPHEGK